MGSAMGSGVSAQQAPARAGAGLPPSELFAVAWTDLTDFHEDLAPAFIGEATAQAAAPIYHLSYVVESPTRVAGRMELRIVNGSGEAWPVLWFHLLPVVLGGGLDVSGVRIDGDAVVPELEHGGALMRLPLPSALKSGAALVVALDFTVSVPTGAQRNYSLLSYRRGILSLAHAYPILAVHRPGSGWDLDPPALYGDLLFARASWFRARVDAPSELELVASGIAARAEGGEAMPAPGTVPGGDGASAAVGRSTWTVYAGPARDLYLSLAPYRAHTETFRGVTVLSHFTEGGETAARTALDQAVRALDVFGARWTPYPYQTLDLVPLSTQALGIEFPGIIALSDRLYRAGATALESTVVHEVAHQWFYGLVGNDQVNDPWLDEALAQYAVWVYARERYGESGADRVLRSFEQRWRSADRDVPIGLPVTSYTADEYGSVVYGRGPLVIVELMEKMGEETFDAFLRGYVASLRWQIATPDAFRRGAEAACACSLESLFTSAIEGP